jgi:hypothetical protein
MAAAADVMKNTHYTNCMSSPCPFACPVQNKGIMHLSQRAFDRKYKDAAIRLRIMSYPREFDTITRTLPTRYRSSAY